jgi:hypothetical protein
MRPKEAKGSRDLRAKARWAAARATQAALTWIMKKNWTLVIPQ